MKIRTQLVLAWFVLSILPLSAIVLYSYHSSRHALEGAYHKEAQQLTAQMDRRLTSIRTDLDQRLATLSALPIQTIPDTKRNDPARAAVVDNILMAMGESAPLVDALEFLPTKPRIVAAPTPPAPGQTPAKVASGPTPDADAADTEADTESTATAEEVDPPDPPDTNAEAETGNAIVIDLPPVTMPKFVLPLDFHKRVAEISQMSRDLSAKSASMTSAQREDVQRKIREKSKELENSLGGAREAFHEKLQEAQQRMSEQMLQRQEQLADAQRQRAENQAERERERIERERERVENKSQHAAKAATAAPSAKASTAATPAPAVAATPAPLVRVRRQLSVEEKQRLTANEKQTSLLFGRHFDVSLSNGGEVVGQIRAKLSTSEIVKRILGSTEDRDEVPFALDRESNLYTRNENDRATLERLGIADALKRHKAFGDVEGWIIAVTEDKESGLRVGAARPVGENLEELRNTAARNFGYGMGLIAFALIGIVPLANHLTRDVKMVTDGASRIAQGDLQTRLPVQSKNEFGQLAVAFNQMAEDLSRNQQQIYEQERARREQEVHQRVLSLEYERKSVELEDARRFQLSMLPKEVPKHDRFDVGVFTQTATEVGGDYYDFHLDSARGLSVTIGDATGHGAKAGTMVTVIKTLFSGYDSTVPPSEFLRDAAEKIKRMELGRMAMALALARFTNDSLTIASAGMPPLLVHRRGKAVEEIELPATPLGTLGVEYEQRLVSLSAGDTVLLMTDGFPELQNASGQQLGYVAAMNEFESAAAASNAQGVIKGLADAVRRWHGDLPPNDDITFVVVRCRA